MSGKKTFVKAWIAYILVFAVIISFAQPVMAANSDNAVHEISFQKGEETCSLRAIQNNNAWYVEANSLAEASGSKLSINKGNGQVSLYRGEDITILYQANADTYLQHDGEYFLPLQTATVSVGLQFAVENGALRARQLKVPKELITDLSAMFRNSQYSTTKMIVDLGSAYTALNIASRIYAILPFVGSSNIMEEVTGAGDRNRYEAAFATILANEGALSELIADTATFHGELKHSNKIFETSQKILAKDGLLADFFNKKGIDSKLLESLITEFSPYDTEGQIMEWFSGFATVTEVMNVGEFWNLATFYASAIDAEESMARAMVSVFKNSENARLREAAINVCSLRYGNGATAETSFFVEWFGDRIFDLICEKAEKQLIELKGIAQLQALVITKAIDFATGASDKSNAILYTTVYSSIQQELASYYYNHVYDTEQGTAMLLRGAGIMYLKAALAAYENYEFDKDLEQALNNVKTMLLGELEKILAYSEEEYCPTYDNACVLEWVCNGAERQDAEKYLKEFLISGEYKEHISEEWNSGELEYVIFDINADKTPEMLIQATKDSPFYNTWLFAVQGGTVRLIDEKYGYGEYRYSPSQNAVIGSPEYKPFAGTSTSPFYRLDDTRFELAFTIFQDDGIWYYSSGNRKTKISEEERSAYFGGALWFEWETIQSLDSWSPTSLLGAPLSEAISAWGAEYSETGYSGSKLVMFENGCAVILEWTPELWEDANLKDNIVAYVLLTNAYSVNGFSAGMTLAEIERVAKSKSITVDGYISFESERYAASFNDGAFDHAFEWEYGVDPQQTPSLFHMIFRVH